ncbi:unnamed protein product [Cercospora beticola]|nr:unnamed protein product [Cercospora beticola]
MEPATKELQQLLQRRGWQHLVEMMEAVLSSPVGLGGSETSSLRIDNARPTSTGTLDKRLEPRLLSYQVEKTDHKRLLQSDAVIHPLVQHHEQITKIIEEFERESAKIEDRYCLSPEEGQASFKLYPSAKPELDPETCEELDQRIEFLADLNKELRSIASSMAPQNEYDHDSAPWNNLLTRESSRSVASGPPQTAVSVSDIPADNESSTAPDASLSASTDIRRSSQELCGLWTACSSAASTMALSALSDDASFHDLQKRLRIWGKGLFGDIFDLDTLTASTEGLQSKLAEPLAAQLIHIGIEQERIMRAWYAAATEVNRSVLYDAASALRQSLVTTRLTQVLGERAPYPIIDWNHQVDGDRAHDQEKPDVAYLQSMVDILFDYLPAINRVRRAHILEAERIASEKRLNETHNTERGLASFEDKDVIIPPLRGPDAPQTIMLQNAGDPQSARSVPNEQRRSTAQELNLIELFQSLQKREASEQRSAPRTIDAQFAEELRDIISVMEGLRDRANGLESQGLPFRPAPPRLDGDKMQYASFDAPEPSLSPTLGKRIFHQTTST